ncbi:hypothetical protein DICSQDRAFT_181956 [Dichomitus squalens LYAD-421 SS1]|uniref:Fungal-type protein kinase domain-containing protein n=1 Tax=Dichomitus squalens (strain LYAD-421) TaxID=732165 RepID=R7SUK5_DICSQ|nr:uncharacterized protein DICSQDRAFT_181956 [Dichomitus squalens LYAD-421 SS1]EJF59450.1 hypothetical protein DICSQDRAFT_181956 [Dichomitus squalens LYAD-421 SS1]
MAQSAVFVEHEEFINAFFPVPNISSAREVRLQPLKTNPFATLSNADKLNEVVVQAAFSKAVNEHNLIPGFRLRDCGRRPDLTSCQSRKVDSALFRNERATASLRQPWADQVLPVEFTRDPVSFDYSNDPKKSVGSADDQRDRALDQIASRAELIHAVQHRVALFMLVVTGPQIRFVRWDRSGSVVTEPLNYVKHWELFCDILWRIGQCTDVQLGFDPTAARLSPGDPDYVRMTTAARPQPTDVDEKERKLAPGEISREGPVVFKYVRAMFNEAVNSPWPRYRLEVPNGASSRAFLVAKPTFRSPRGAVRGTRGYVALDCATGELVWLKDTWRAHHLISDKEGDVLGRLNEARVGYVPTLICHGDIAGQDTLTLDWWARTQNPRTTDPPKSAESPTHDAPPYPHPSAPSSSGALKRKRDDDSGRSEDGIPLPKRVKTGSGLPAILEDCPFQLYRHYRLAEKEVCMSLEKFQNGRQLVFLVSCGLDAHRQAATLPSNPVLHGDVSGGNILILPRISQKADGAFIEWTGLLNDWEMSIPINSKTTTPIDYEKRSDRARQPTRPGTFQFQSVALLTRRKKEVEIYDELESFFWVILFYGVRYLRTNIPRTMIDAWIEDFFDPHEDGDEKLGCSPRKLYAIKTQWLTAIGPHALKFDSRMDNVIADLEWMFNDHYATWEAWGWHEPSGIDWDYRELGLTHDAMLEELRIKLERPYRDNPDWKLNDKIGEDVPKQDGQTSSTSPGRLLRTNPKLHALERAAHCSYPHRHQPRRDPRIL